MQPCKKVTSLIQPMSDYYGKVAVGCMNKSFSFANKTKYVVRALIFSVKRSVIWGIKKEGNDLDEKKKNSGEACCYS